MRTLSIPVVLLVLLGQATVSAQPTLESLWPNADGNRWDYDYEYVSHDDDFTITSAASIRLDGYVSTPGGEAQNLLAEHDPVPTWEYPDWFGGVPTLPGLDPPMAMIWQARPDLSDKIADMQGDKSRYITTWYLAFLHHGPFIKTAESIQMWAGNWDHATWTYLEDDLSVGATFVHQIAPELFDDLYLYGTVAAVDAEVTTPAGTFTGAVKIEYLLDGHGFLITEDDIVLAELNWNHNGFVHYVPGVGPVELFEEYVPIVWIECPGGDCPPQWEELVGVVVTTQTLELTNATVATQAASWSAVKGQYR